MGLSSLMLAQSQAAGPAPGVQKALSPNLPPSRSLLAPQRESRLVSLGQDHKLHEGGTVLSSAVFPVIVIGVPSTGHGMWQAFRERWLAHTE